MQTTYPEYKWDIYQFLKVRSGYLTYLLETVSEQKEFVKYLEKKFNIKQTIDWYGITSTQLNQIISIDLYTAMKIIKRFYPNIDLSNFRQ